MQTLSSTASLRESISAQRLQGRRIAFVPTMGNLHAGHLQLVRQASILADCVVVSIFVNPMQFGPGEDFATYPRTLDADKAALQAEGVEVLFLPAVEEMYAAGLEQATRIEVPGFEGDLCGRSRPGFFTGIATVVTGLFNRVQPDIAVFGEKDYQQLVMIKRMVRDLCMPIEVQGVATMREADGLAMSSRNAYLDAAQRDRAVHLYQVLGTVKAALESGSRDYTVLEQHALESLQQAGFVPDYVSVREQRSLRVPGPGCKQLVVLGAATLGSTRLIDNISLSIT
ncbi:MAG: pantoate--beta-alanine ligase [Gammaproteobacteria bacterium]|nr:pantoate--beta-alanine ligase [Gammaproteobacteria bacterium]MDH3887407.1 pantoate--beta-alanine ligase [Gammaproteobacteria bacterium]MDH3935149.1 pantoate--beta-alanine ligase [Gammaproteobacteria bacterium]MDH3986424.1 pantoate--beta-alanine ligase [Gammaproteobacteria bacterium]